MFTLPPVLCGERYIDPNLQAVQDLIDQAAGEAERRMPVEVMLAVESRDFEGAVVTRQQYKAVLQVLFSLSHKVAEAIEHGAEKAQVPAQAVSPVEPPPVPHVDYELQLTGRVLPRER